MDLLAALKRSEGKTLEFKRDLSSPDAALRTITAFANTAGGTLLVGVEDATHHVRGVRDALNLEERLANLISDRIVPRLVPGLEILPWRDTHVLGVEVHPSPSRPHFLKREGLERGVYVRVGSTTAAPIGSSSRNCGVWPEVNPTTNRRCLNSTRKRSTSERLQSRSPRFESSGARNSKPCGC